MACGQVENCCSFLEAAPIVNNRQLLDFDVRSRDIDWHEHVLRLQPRGAAVCLQRQFQFMSNVRVPLSDLHGREVLVCHDMMGNYLEDRHHHTSEKYDAYRFYHWPGIDYFCYFSHKYVTIPPCGWINAAHKHGVRILGTYIVENADGSQRLREVLQSRQTVDNAVAALTRLCKHFVFDGWLVNVECDVAPDLLEQLYYFVERLRSVTETQLEHGTVIWYDSVIDTGRVAYQNELNAKNVRFARNSHGTLINYTWNDRSLQATKQICGDHQLARKRVFFGIDVFGRNQIAKFRTKLTLARIVEQNFSACIFAPGWTYETLQQFGYNIHQPLGDQVFNDSFLRRNEKWWSSLWEHFATHAYNRLPFYTDFCLGSGQLQYQHGKPLNSSPMRTQTGDQDSGDSDDSSARRFYNLSRQSLQPSVPLYDCAERHYDDAYNGGSCLRIVKSGSPFRLLVLDMPIARRGLVVAYACKLATTAEQIDCVLRFCDAADQQQQRDCYLFCGDYYDMEIYQQGRCYVSPFKPAHMHMLTSDLTAAQLPKQLHAQLPSDWRVCYYVVGFDAPVRLLDFGVLYRNAAQPSSSQPTPPPYALLGAVYLQEFDLSVREFPESANYSYIEVRGQNLYNTVPL